MKNSTITEIKKERELLIEKLKMIDRFILRGSLIERYRRCGKPNCHCATEEKGHGPVHYLSVSMSGTKPIMIYVPLAYKEAVEKALSNYKATQQIMEEISNINRELLAQRESF